MTIQIKSVFGDIIKELDAKTLIGADLYGANLRDANLRDANLRDANLRDANLRDANLRGANLRDANLCDANLRGANLRGANLRGANLGSQWIIQGPCRSDGYWFFIQKLTEDEEPMIKAGCHYLTINEANDHWRSTRGGTKLGDETMLILKFLEDAAKLRGFI